MRSVIEMLATHQNSVIVSLNSKKRPSGKDLITLGYGNDLYEIAGLIRKKVSFWAIDESGSVGRTQKSIGRAITYSAVTQLSHVDYEGVFEGIPLSRDKFGNEELHYIDLRWNNPEKLAEVVQRIGESPFLIVSLPIEKTEVDTRKRWYRPKNAMYVLSAIGQLVDAIGIIDQSDTIVVTFDETDDMTNEYLDILWTDRIIVRADKSYLVKLLQISDIAASVTGNAINYPEELNTDLFWKLYRINTNMSARGLTTSATSDGGTDKHTKSLNYKNKSERSKPICGLTTSAPSDGGIGKHTKTSNYKNKSQRSKPIRGLVTTAPSDGGIGNFCTTNRHKMIPIKRRFGRLFR